MEENIQNALGAIYEMLGSARWTVYTDKQGNIQKVVWSEELKRMIGYEKTDEFPDEIRTLLDRIHPEDRAFAVKELKTVLKDMTGTKKYDIEERILRKDGKYHWFRSIGKYIESEDGEYNTFYGVILSIDEQKRYEEEIKKQAEEMAKANQRYLDQLKVIEGMSSEYATVWLAKVPEMTFTLYRNTGNSVPIDAVDQVQSMNSYYDGMKEYARDYIHPEDQEEFLEKISYEVVKEEIKKHRAYRVNYRRIYRGKTEYYQAKFARTANQEVDDFVVGYKNVDEEVREEMQKRKALEAALTAAEQANESKTVFLNNISHDIRTPMNGIIGMTAIAGAHLEDSKRVGECLKKITLASNHLLSLINDILDVSKIESGKMLLVEEEFSLAEQFETMVNIITPQIKAKRQELSVEIEHVIHENVIGDSLRLQQVFMNIVSNAIKYTPEGGKISIRLKEAEVDSENYSKYIFLCKDTGYGMKEEFLDRLFLPFEREDKEENRRISGTGLGMAIAKNIIRMMDGDITVESEYQKGSCFTVEFRLKRKNCNFQKDDALRGLTALVVEDEWATCESTCLTLKELGIYSEYAVSGKEAVEKVIRAQRQAREYQMCLIDWKMPEMDGIETTRKIREIIGDKMPIIIVSAYDWADIEVEARAAGANGFLSKPLFRSRLEVTIRNVLSGKEQKTNDNLLKEYREKDFSDKRILLVEDNELNREIAMEILTMTGVKIETAEDGREALQLFEFKKPGYYDMIFMDIQMPIMDGLQATRAIRQLNRPDAVKIPIVAMSANAFVEDRECSKRAGMNEHLEKPINLPKLLGVMEEYLGQRVELHREIFEKPEIEIQPIFGKYYERLYFTKGDIQMSKETEKACIHVLSNNGAVGVFGLQEEKDYPISFVSEFALLPLGYTYQEFMKATKGYFLDLIYEDDKKKFLSEFYDDGQKHHYRIVAKSGEIMIGTTYIAGNYLIDGKKTRILSLRVEPVANY